MTLDELSEIGKALYGPNWQSALARDLGVSDRTVRRWVATESPLPADLDTRLAAFLAARADPHFTFVLDKLQLVHKPSQAVFQVDASGAAFTLHQGFALPSQMGALARMAAALALRNHGLAERLTYAWIGQGGVAETSKPFQSHDPAERLKRIKEIMVAAQAKTTARPDAARSADVLYDDDGLPH